MHSIFKGRSNKRTRNIVPLSETAPWRLYGSQRAERGVKPLRQYSSEINAKLYIFLGDITELQIDCIVNAANNSLLGGGGVDGAIHAAAGPALREECSKLSGCSTGDAKITKGHNLPAKHIIHTVGPRGRQPEVLRSSYSRCFELMRENELKSIAFPCISTGVYGYPNKAAAKVAIQTTRDFVEKNLSEIDGVIFCLFTNRDIEAYHELLPAYFPLDSGETASKEEVTSKEETVSNEDGLPGENEAMSPTEDEEGKKTEEKPVATEESKSEENKDSEDDNWSTGTGDEDEAMSQQECEPVSQEPMSYQEEEDTVTQVEETVEKKATENEEKTVPKRTMEDYFKKAG